MFLLSNKVTTVTRKASYRPLNEINELGNKADIFPIFCKFYRQWVFPQMENNASRRAFTHRARGKHGDVWMGGLTRLKRQFKFASLYIANFQYNTRATCQINSQIVEIGDLEPSIYLFWVY